MAKLPNSYVFPAVFFEDEEDRGMYNVRFPDLPNCFTSCKTLAEAIEQAPRVMGDILYMAEKEDRAIPVPTAREAVELEPGEMCQLVAVYMPPVRRAWSRKAVRKTLAIPAYLADLAEQAGVNYSQLLQQALKREFQVQ